MHLHFLKFELKYQFKKYKTIYFLKADKYTFLMDVFFIKKFEAIGGNDVMMNEK